MIFLQREGHVGTLSFAADSARILKDGNVVVDWTSGGSISGIPEGDGYTVEYQTAGVVTSDTLAVGAIVLTLGQSNMDGWFETPSLATTTGANSYYLYNGAWTTTQGQGAVAFANQYSATYGVPVAFVNGSVGGSSLVQSGDIGYGYWESGPASLLASAVAKLDSVGGKAEVTLWGQGEANANLTSSQYGSALALLFGSINASVGDTEIYVVGLGPTVYANLQSGYAAVRAGQIWATQQVDNAHYVATDLDLEIPAGPHLSGAARAWQAREVVDAMFALSGTGVAPAAEILGTSAAEVLKGTSDNDRIAGYEGDDSIFGAGGDDTVRGGDGNDTIDGGTGNDVMSGGAGHDLLTGGTGNDEIYGDDGNDTIYGGAGNDLIFGGLGENLLVGGEGDDTYSLLSQTDTIVELAGEGIDTVRTAFDYTLGDNVENLTMTGTQTYGTGNALDNVITGFTSNNVLSGLDGNDKLYGLGGNDTLLGGAGNDTLDGGTGNDSLVGGTGDDVYYVDSLTDVVVESANEGIDTVYVTLPNYTAPSNVEVVVFNGPGNFTGIGNDLNNTIIGGGGSDYLIGGAGADYLVGGAYGADTLDGGVGADTMVGGTGNDVYIVDTSDDVVVEAAGEASDTVQANASYVLSANVETLVLTGTGAWTGVGNDQANTITGNNAANLLSGGGGNDTLNGGLGNDTLDGGAGNDVMAGGTGDDTYYVGEAADLVNENANEGIDLVYTTLAAYTLSSTVENLIFSGTGPFYGVGNTLDNLIIGGASNDTLGGGNGADTLDGGAGADSLTGGAGNDTYYVDNVGDVVVEYNNGGTDTVLTTLSTYNLPKYVEQLVYTGTGNFNATGTTAADTIVADAGNDTLNGGAGDDVLIGNGGNDVLIGGAGNDTAVFAGASTDYQLATVNGVLQISARPGSAYSGVTSLSSIENLRFSDGVYSTSTNYAPIANGDAATGYKNGAITVNALANDTDFDGGPSAMAVVLGTGPSNGTVQLNADGTITYTPNADFVGSDSFTYSTTDSALTSAPATVTVTVLERNYYAPTLTSATALSVAENTTAVVTLTATDKDSAAASLTYSIAPTADGAAFKIVDGNKLVFVAAPDYDASAQAKVYYVDVIASDGQLQTTTRLTVSVTDVNDTAPVITSATTVSVAENTTSVVNLTASDVDTVGGPLTFALASGADANLFRIVNGNQLEFITAPDYESTTHAPSYLVDVNISDGTNVSTKTIVVNVTDVYEGSPDTVQTSASKYTLDATSHNLIYTGSGDFWGIGNGLDNAITGGIGNDTLDGGAGADTLTGGAGNDLYLNVTASETIVEAAGGGTDTIQTALAVYTLGANIENLTYTGTSKFAGTGNELANLIVGGALADTLMGGDGDDTLMGGAGADSLVGGAGTNTASYANAASGVSVSLVSPGTNTGDAAGDTLKQIVNLTGSAFNDVLEGAANANVLDGGDGNDRLFGGDGADTLIGGNGADYLDGGLKNDILQGGYGNDTLVGGVGYDTLTGGGGSDVFVFTSTSDVYDVITDFTSGTDKIALTASGFGVTTSTQVSFVSGASPVPTTAGPTIYYDTTTSTAWWDADGTGAGKAVQIAILSNHATVTASDFVLV